MQVSLSSVLEFWLGEVEETQEYLRARTAIWFMGGEVVDRILQKRFGSLLESIAAGKVEAPTGPLDKLATIIVLDQFSRNIFRGTPRAFTQDAQALRLAKEMIAAGEEKILREIPRVFAYLPFEHSENLADQELSVDYFRQLTQGAPGALKEAFEQNLDYAVRHRDIIRRFGRFPHRNAILDRQSTPEELEFLKTPGSSF
ncbi:DUF924 domain-containing protein [bacterium]|nr:DUF924 domain-containing protein [bacterium]